MKPKALCYYQKQIKLFIIPKSKGGIKPVIFQKSKNNPAEI